MAEVEQQVQPEVVEEQAPKTTEKKEVEKITEKTKKVCIRIHICLTILVLAMFLFFYVGGSFIYFV